MAMCYILDKYNSSWKDEYYASDKNLFDYFISRFTVETTELPKDKIQYSISNYNTNKVIDNHTKSYNKFNNQSGTRITLVFKEKPQFRGFDPMNAESVNENTVLHNTLLKLKGKNDNGLFISNWPVVSQYEEQIWFVNKVILFVPEKEIHVTANQLVIATDNVKITWSGSVRKTGENEIVINCN